ncbi:MAG: hypothetical protein RL768_2946 [Nitrospirota bacterium]|jgi:catechol 2,3-dioxygenase-like lactoylglutathione lyase family enzyme
MTIEMSHVGVGVSNVDRSADFYCNVLGYARATRLSGGQETAALVGFEGEVAFTSQFLVKDGQLLELVQFKSPAPVPASQLRPMNLAGLTHLSFRVTSGIDELLSRVEANGGRILEETRSATHFSDGSAGTCIFCLDPDGTRVEIMEMPEVIRFDREGGIALAD